MAITSIVSRNAIALWRITETSEASGKGSAGAFAEAVRLSDFQTVLVSVLMPAPLIQYVNRVVMFDGQNHGLENIHVPAIRDSQTNNIVGLRHQAPAQRHSQVPCYYPEYHRLPHPDRVATYHLSPLMRL
jgi:hypothetical protein